MKILLLSINRWNCNMCAYSAALDSKARTSKVACKPAWRSRKNTSIDGVHVNLSIRLLPLRNALAPYILNNTFWTVAYFVLAHTLINWPLIFHSSIVLRRLFPFNAFYDESPFSWYASVRKSSPDARHACTSNRWERVVFQSKHKLKTTSS